MKLQIFRPNKQPLNNGGRLFLVELELEKLLMRINDVRGLNRTLVRPILTSKNFYTNRAAELPLLTSSTRPSGAVTSCFAKNRRDICARLGKNLFVRLRCASHKRQREKQRQANDGQYGKHF